ncbi:MAG: 16S rRNA (cytidine(1402)-2'-O)-methyltransferase [Deltaproteobacteria bacterium]|nr:16S rRNA (cytidine(1402)-2'-O)-methyltransferase [Deltaproteobacteria bacterium]
MNSGTLLVVATPIGNLEDITLRALKCLERAQVIAAEDTRVTRKLLTRHRVDTPLVSFREQNATRAIPQLLAHLEHGHDVALVSDAGTPSISDPGEQLVRAAAEAGYRVSPIPGPSALAAVLSVAGLAGDGVRFIGFLPRTGKRRRERLAVLAEDPACTVLYEAPTRLGKTLLELAAACGDERHAVVARELTKVHEEIARGPLVELVQRFSGPVKGEIAIVVAGADGVDIENLSEERLLELVQQKIEAGQSAKDVAKNLAPALGLPRKRIYQLAVEAIGKLRS